MFEANYINRLSLNRFVKRSSICMSF